jgi:PKD domain
VQDDECTPQNACDFLSFHHAVGRRGTLGKFAGRRHACPLLANNGKVASNERLELYTMQIRARLLTVSLLAVVSCCTMVIGQQPGTVNVRPRVVTAQPGVPSVRVNVDRNRVPVGDEVTFTLAPASLVRNPRFTVTIYFGDGAQKEMHQTEIVHPYAASGNYTYSVLVKPSQSPRDPVSDTTPVPVVKLIVNPTTVAINSPVNFTAQLSHNYPNIRYRFVFGDGAQTDWQDAPQTTHSYGNAKTYLAYVDIGEGSSGVAKRIGGSQRQAIQVTAPQNIRVDLLAKPVSVKTGDTVRFAAQARSREPKLKYRFAFGDGALTSWQDSSETNHQYAVAGDYFASVEVGFPSGQGIKTAGTSRPAKIGVAAGPGPRPSPSPRPSPKPTVSPSPTPLPSPSPSPSPTNSTSPESSPNPSPTATATSSGTPDGNNSPGGQTNSTSPEVTPTPSVSPTPTVSGPLNFRDNWWKYLLIALLLIFLAYKAATFFLFPRPKFIPHPDPGNSRVGAEKPLSIDLQLGLDPNVTGGEYGIETPDGGLIKSERGTHG